MAANNLITYSVKAKAHDLTLLKLKSQNLSGISSEVLVNQYLEEYSKIYCILEVNRLENLKLK